MNKLISEAVFEFGFIFSPALKCLLSFIFFLSEGVFLFHIFTVFLQISL